MTGKTECNVLVVDDQRMWRSFQLWVGSLHLARAIEAATTRPHIGVMLPTSGLFPLAMLATWRLGRTLVPVNYLLSPQEQAYILEDAGIDTVITVGPMDTVEEAARLMATQKISALPVTEGGRLVGIVTETDLLALFVRAMGVLEPSSRLDVILPAPEVPLGDVVQAVEGAGVRIVSLMTMRGPGGEREVVLRVATINPEPAVAALQARGYRVRDADRGAASRA